MPQKATKLGQLWWIQFCCAFLPVSFNTKKSRTVMMMAIWVQISGGEGTIVLGHSTMWVRPKCLHGFLAWRSKNSPCISTWTIGVYGNSNSAIKFTQNYSAVNERHSRQIEEKLISLSKYGPASNLSTYKHNTFLHAEVDIKTVFILLINAALLIKEAAKINPIQPSAGEYWQNRAWLDHPEERRCPGASQTQAEAKGYWAKWRFQHQAVSFS